MKTNSTVIVDMEYWVNPVKINDEVMLTVRDTNERINAIVTKVDIVGKTFTARFWREPS